MEADPTEVDPMDGQGQRDEKKSEWYHNQTFLPYSITIYLSIFVRYSLSLPTECVIIVFLV